jgi:hypothetical protein
VPSLVIPKDHSSCQTHEIVGYDVEFRQVGLGEDGEICSKGPFRNALAAALVDSQKTARRSEVRLCIDRDFICDVDEIAGFEDEKAAESRVNEFFDEATFPEVMAELRSFIGDLCRAHER